MFQFGVHPKIYLTIFHNPSLEIVSNAALSPRNRHVVGPGIHLPFNDLAQYEDDNGVHLLCLNQNCMMMWVLLILANHCCIRRPLLGRPNIVGFLVKVTPPPSIDISSSPGTRSPPHDAPPLWKPLPTF